MAELTRAWRERLNRALDAPNLSPNQVEAIRRYHQKGSDRDISRALEANARERQYADQQVAEHTAKAKAALEELTQRVMEARSGRLSSKQLAALRNDLLKFARYIGGDGEGGKWKGIKHTYDGHYEQIDQIDSAPGDHVDAFWQKWGPSMGLDRFDVRD